MMKEVSSSEENMKIIRSFKIIVQFPSFIFVLLSFRVISIFV